MCDTLCVPTADGMLFAKNSDRPPNEAQVVESYAARPGGGSLQTQYLTIPDADAAALVGSRPTWLWGLEHGVNEHGVAIGNEKIWTIDDPRAAPPALIGMDLVRLALERAFAEGWIQASPPAVRSGKRIAVVGSGPAGLAAADQLNKAGHLVTVFEKSDRIGGLLRYGIPEFKIEKRLVNRRLDILEQEGVVFRPGVSIGEDVSAASLRRDFHAVVLCCGAGWPRDLQVPLGDLVADMEIHDRDLRTDGRILRQPRLRGRGRSLIPTPHRKRAR